MSRRHGNDHDRFDHPVPDDRVMGAPRYTPGRPPTRAEVWESEHSKYFEHKSHKQHEVCTPKCRHTHDDSPGELEAWCRDKWVGSYVYAYNREGWRKQPDWKENDPIISAAVPTEVFWAGQCHKHIEIVYRCFNQAKAAA